MANRETTLADIHSDLDFLAYQLQVELGVAEIEHPSFMSGRVAQVSLNNKPVGVLGELHPEVLKRWEIGMPVAAFEINLGTLI
jgi:phenylalanyl-tRNA synthetase beta chain